MTEPKDEARRPDPPADGLPDVDTLIHEARESSWHLPDADPPAVDVVGPVGPGEPGAPDAGAASADVTAPAPPSDAAYPAADAAQLHPRSGAHPAASPGASAAAHGGGHDAGDEIPLGPVDLELWGAGILATVIGLFMAICFVLATAVTGAY